MVALINLDVIMRYVYYQSWHMYMISLLTVA